MKKGIYKRYSKVNQAWFVMWHHELLRVFNDEEEADHYIKELLNK